MGLKVDKSTRSSKKTLISWEDDELTKFQQSYVMAAVPFAGIREIFMHKDVAHSNLFPGEN